MEDLIALHWPELERCEFDDGDCDICGRRCAELYFAPAGYPGGDGTYYCRPDAESIIRENLEVLSSDLHFDADSSPTRRK